MQLVGLLVRREGVLELLDVEPGLPGQAGPAGPAGRTGAPRTPPGGGHREGGAGEEAGGSGMDE